MNIAVAEVIILHSSRSRPVLAILSLLTGIALVESVIIFSVNRRPIGCGWSFSQMSAEVAVRTDGNHSVMDRD